jgi:hypothetical protein
VNDGVAMRLAVACRPTLVACIAKAAKIPDDAIGIFLGETIKTDPALAVMDQNHVSPEEALEFAAHLMLVGTGGHDAKEA